MIKSLFKKVVDVTKGRSVVKGFDALKTNILGTPVVPKEEFFIYSPDDNDTMLDRTAKINLNLTRLSSAVPEKILTDFIIKEWNTRYLDKWKDSYDQRYILTSGVCKCRFSKLDEFELIGLHTRSISEWDLTMLVETMKTFNIHASTKIFEEMLLIEDKLYYDDLENFTYEVLFDYWRQLAVRLLQINIKHLQIIDRCKPFNIKIMMQTMKHLEPDPKVKEVKNLADQLFKKEKFEHCINLYMQVIGAPNIPINDIISMYSNLSTAYYHLKDYSSANKNSCIHDYFSSKMYQGFPDVDETPIVAPNYEKVFLDLVN